MLVNEVSITLIAIEHRLLRDIMTLCNAMRNGTLKSLECSIAACAVVWHSGGSK